MRQVYDVLYGFIPLTEWEEALINSPFFQRLRWIKQLGFSSAIFPGAEHNRFSHVIGVMHSMQQMLEALGLARSWRELVDLRVQTTEVLLHRHLRVAALLHDIGTFPFSHAIERAYLKQGEKLLQRVSRGERDLPDSHEHLGSFIIKNTSFEGGVTSILNRYELDVQAISWMIKGEASEKIANQLMHSDLDADRLDYLRRDAYYTGLDYGQFDRDYLLSNLALFDLPKGQLGFGVKEQALRTIEDFLLARFSWYSQIIKNTGSAKFDILASYVTELLLEKKEIYSFSDLLQLISEGDARFFWWNDLYLMHRFQTLSQELPESLLKDGVDRILYRRPPKTLRHPVLEPLLFTHEEEKKDRIHQILDLLEGFEQTVQQTDPLLLQTNWLLVDLPQKDLSICSLVPADGDLATRDPIKIIPRGGPPQFLGDSSHSLLKWLKGVRQFVPSLYASEALAAKFQVVQELLQEPLQK